MAVGKELYGFGFVPRESEHHFVVSIPRSDANDVEVTEWFAFGDQSTLAASAVDDAASRPATETSYQSLQVDAHRRRSPGRVQSAPANRGKEDFVLEDR